MRCGKNRAQSQRRPYNPSPFCRFSIHSPCLCGKAHPAFESQPHRSHYSRAPRCGQCDFRTISPGPSVRHAAEPLGVTVGPQAIYPNYNKPSTREGILNRALFRAAVSLPPASAKSGLPPPLPPTIGANACISLPALTLGVRSLVTPAISEMSPSSTEARTTTPLWISWRNLSRISLSCCLLTPSTRLQATFTPLTS